MPRPAASGWVGLSRGEEVRVATRAFVVTEPTVEDLRIGLQRILGDEFDGIWDVLCVGSGIDPQDPDGEGISNAHVDVLLESIADHDPLCRIISMSWRIRRSASEGLESAGRKLDERGGQ